MQVVKRCKRCLGKGILYDAEDGCPMDCHECGGYAGTLEREIERLRRALSWIAQRDGGPYTAEEAANWAASALKHKVGVRTK